MTQELNIDDWTKLLNDWTKLLKEKVVPDGRFDRVTWQGILNNVALFFIMQGRRYDIAEGIWRFIVEKDPSCPLPMFNLVGLYKASIEHYGKSVDTVDLSYCLKDNVLTSDEISETEKAHHQGIERVKKISERLQVIE